MQINRENEIEAIHKNCLLEGYEISYEECAQLYKLIAEDKLSEEEAIKIVYGNR